MTPRQANVMQLGLPLARGFGDAIASPLPMQYLGSKSRIAEWIVSGIQEEFPRCTTFADLFSGTGSVALSASRHGYKVWVNDLQAYSATVLRSIFVAKRDGIRELRAELEGLRSTSVLLAGQRGSAEDLFAQEARFRSSLEKRSWDWKSYRQFCEATPLVTGTAEEAERLRLTHGWDLFTKYYPNTYFGVHQCLQLDALREWADGLSADLAVHVKAAAVSAMTYGVSSTTHLAQFLKPSTEVRARNLLRVRGFDLITAVSERLGALEALPLPDLGAEVLELDFRDALSKSTLDAATVVYADPPYFKEHYSRYYHVLDTFCLYDYPSLTHNPRLGVTTVGRYRASRSISPFGLRSSVRQAFADLLSMARWADARVAISYANTSLIHRADIIALAEENKYCSRVIERSLLHSGQGQPRGRQVLEYLFLLTPRD